MPIRILPSDLSSQIAAGEIIECPASVVKEIIENSIDAGAKNINILVENSGFQSIILQDDGCGIPRQELLLAISHHATSKIYSLSDLDIITTFGFRGEALASIRAVSRLTLISCTKYSHVGWKIYTEGLSINDNITLQPIGHPRGTTIIIENLFYNMPVRLKFVKNKKLEFLKICKIVKKIALSHFHINFSLKHNNKLIIQYNSIHNKSNKINRLKDVINTFDINQLIEIKKKKDNISLFGWIENPYTFEVFKNIQYCYVNSRYIYNDIMINSVRSAYYKIVGKTNMSFILYLKIASNNIDINIHPTKNEIKFHEPDLIYTFIYKTIIYNLKKIQCLFKNTYYEKKMLFFKKKEANLDFSYSVPGTTSVCSLKKKSFSKDINIKKKYECSIGKLLIVIRKYYGLIYSRNNFSLISFPLAKGIIRKQKLKNNIKQKIIPENFLSNIKINLTSEEYMILFQNKEILLKIGFHLIFKKNYVILSSIPIFLKKRNLDIVIPNFFSFLFLKKKLLISEIVNWFYKNIFIELKNWSYLNGIRVLLEMEYYCPYLIINPPEKLLQEININAELCILKI